MTYIVKLNTFAEVEEKYNSTAVLVSKQHSVEQDIRPIGKRSRKWERIIKINKNCYALSCGGSADPVFTWRWSPKLKEYPLRPVDIERLSPIVWRYKDGTETVTVRNGQGDWQYNAVYSFLYRALPRELWFRINRQGRQAIYNRSEGKEYYLPKTKTVPRHVYFQLREDKERHKNQHTNKRFEAVRLGFDNLSLTFQRQANGTFTLVGEAPVETVNRIRIDKNTKAAFKDGIAELYEWVSAMLPLMRSQLNYELRREMAKQVEDLCATHKLVGYRSSWSSLFANTEPELIRSVFADAQHPLRYALGIAAMFEVNAAATELERLRDNDWHYSGMSEGDFDKLTASKVRAAYTRWVNKVGGFTTVTKEEK